MQRSSGIIPTYSVIYNFPVDTKSVDDVELTQQDIEPKNATPSPALVKYVTLVAREYVFANREDPLFKQLSHIKGRVSFDTRTGLTLRDFNDKRIEEFFLSQRKEGVNIPMEEARAKNLLDFCRFKSPKVKKSICVDALTWKFWNEGVKIEEFDFRIILTKATSVGGGLTTGNMRFPHLLLAICNFLYQAGRVESMDLQVCIIGPGFNPGERLSECPQLVELRAIMPDAHYLLLDNDKTALESMNKALKQVGLLSYDPAMLRSRTLVLRDQPNPWKAPEPLFSILDALKLVLKDQVVSPKNALPMLKGEGKIEEMVVKVDPAKIDLREFDILASEFTDKEKGKFDVIVATMSLSLVVNLKTEKRTALDDFKLVAKFIAPLRTNGVLYIDSHLGELFDRSYGQEGVQLGHQYLEAVTGFKLNVVLYPLSKVEPTIKSLTGNFLNVSCKGEPRSITTAAIECLQLTNVKVETTSEKLAEIVAQLEKLTRNDK